jgi:hypothetical protein
MESFSTFAEFDFGIVLHGGCFRSLPSKNRGQNFTEHASNRCSQRSECWASKKTVLPVSENPVL